jgi:hypothetical protein
MVEPDSWDIAEAAGCRVGQERSHLGFQFRRSIKNRARSQVEPVEDGDSDATEMSAAGNSPVASLSRASPDLRRPVSSFPPATGFTQWHFDARSTTGPDQCGSTGNRTR